MKRSEFIKHIANVITRESKYELTPNELAKEILVECELLGMLPSVKEIYENGSYLDVHEWDEE